MRPGSLFLDVLDIAERDFGFSTKDYNLKVETVALSNGAFVLTITRILDTEINDTNSHSLYSNSKGPKAIRRKTGITSSMVYKFGSFDDFCNFVNVLYSNIQVNYKKISKDSALYLFQNNYYLIFLNINTKFQDLKKTFSIITEFGTYITSSDVFIAKINEAGKPIFKTRAIMNCLHYFKV